MLDAVEEDTVLVTVMHSNNEVGSIMPTTEIAKGCRAKGVLFHTDAAQSCGKIGVDVKLCPADLITVVGHKFGAPKGVAALYIRNGCISCEVPGFGSCGAFLCGGGQEGGRRAGTENVLLVVALGEACRIVADELPRTSKHMSMLRDRLASHLTGASGLECRVNGPSEPYYRLPNTLSISLRGVPSGLLLQRLHDKLAASAGSACHTGGGVSQVLRAMKIPDEYATGTLRLSVGRHTLLKDVDAAATLIISEARILLAQGTARL